MSIHRVISDFVIFLGALISISHKKLEQFFVDLEEKTQHLKAVLTEVNYEQEELSLRLGVFEKQLGEFKQTQDRKINEMEKKGNVFFHSYTTSLKVLYR